MITLSNFVVSFDFHDCFQVSCAVVRLLLEYGANPDLLCEGHSALSLAICSGNDLVRFAVLETMILCGHYLYLYVYPHVSDRDRVL